MPLRRYTLPHTQSSFYAATLALAAPLPCLTQLSLVLSGSDRDWMSDGEEFDRLNKLRDSWREAVCQLQDAKPGCRVILRGGIMEDSDSYSNLYYDDD